MEKKLIEVMPELSISPELKECADSIRINKICLTRDRREVHIYINSSRLISKRSVFVLESAIKAQLFSKKDIKVLIFEHFLMDDINAEEVYAQYKDSILLELKTMHLLDYQMLSKADISFPEDEVMLIYIPDTIINRSRARSVDKYLAAVFSQRFGLGVSVRFSFHQAEHELLKSEDFDDSKTANMLNRAFEAASFGRRNRPQTKDRPEPKGWKGRRGRRLSPEEGFGREFDGTALPISEIKDEIGEVVIAGEVISLEVRTTKTGKKLFIFVVTDHTDSIQAKLFCQPEEEQEVSALVKKGAGIILKGRAVIDTFSHEVALSSIEGIKPYKRDVNRREDNAAVKRVELHCHTKMSDMDAVSSVGDIIAQAARFGHKAIAITDHGVVQAFPDAMKAAEKNGIKVLYGCEGYLAD
ncbi:MAG: PHP domain-containing protein, partial [Lachnospiraceae bacterium]|nr:PHP domain-containing protein [Lachnospiraceae bacterium]